MTQELTKVPTSKDVMWLIPSYLPLHLPPWQGFSSFTVKSLRVRKTWRLRQCHLLPLPSMDETQQAAWRGRLHQCKESPTDATS